MSYSAENFEALKQTIEQASKIVISPNVSKNERTNSENIFMELRGSKSPYEFCRYLLESSKEPYVQFQAVSTLQEAALREWTLLPQDLVPALQNFLFNYAINYSASNEKYVQRQILQTIAVFYKRSKLDSFNSKHVKETRNIVKESIELFNTNNIKLRHLICSLMLAILNEFSNSSKSTKLGLSNDSHFTAKRSFEQNEFKSILIFEFETTQNLIESLIKSNITSIRMLDSDSKEMLLQLFMLIDQSFNWEFTSSKHLLKNLIGNFNQMSNQTSLNLEPTPEFRDFFLNPNLVILLFKCYELVRDDPDMAHASFQPIIQLSTLNGTILYSEQTDQNPRVNFVNSFLQSFLTCFTKIEIRDYETVNLSCLIDNLMSSANLKLIDCLDNNLIEPFFNIVCAFMVNCFKAEKTCQDSVESKKYLESYEKILISWSHLKECLNENQKFMLLFTNYSANIVEAFIQSRLAYNLDIVQEENIQLNVDEEEEDEDEDDSNEDDLHRYKEILYSITDFARCCLKYIIPLLSNLLTEKYTQLTQVLKQIIQTNATELLNKHLNNLNEDIHWILLISGFVLYDINSDLNEPRIPNEVMKYSIETSSRTDLELVKTVMFELNQSDPRSVNLGLLDKRIVDSEPVDFFTRFVFNACQLCELEVHMSMLNMLHYLSPQVASTLIWFLKELSHCYFFFKENLYTELSPTIHTLFSSDSKISYLILNYYLRKILSNFYIWSSENTTCIQTARFLLELSKHKEMSKIFLENEQYWSFSKVVSVNEQPWIMLSSNVKKLIIKSLVISCTEPENSLMQEFFNKTVLKQLENRFELFGSIKPEFIHSESCIKEIMSLIESLNGIIEGTSKKMVKDLVGFVLPRLKQGVYLLDLYHNYGEIVELILCMFNGVIEKYLAQLTECSELRNEILKCFLELIRIFSKHNSNKKSIEANIEEDYYNDLLLFLTLLNTLHNIDYDNQEDDDRLQHAQIKVVDIILVGLEFLIALMNQEILKFQSLAIEYFKLISNISYNNSQKLFETSFNLFQSLINSIEYGINSGLGAEVVRYSLECVSPMCQYLFKNDLKQTPHGQCLRGLFQVVFQFIFGSPMDTELFDVCSSLLYTFITCFQDFYSILVSQLIEQYNDENLRLKLIEGFNYLTPNNLIFNLEKRNRIKFNSKFNEFCIKTYGLLFIR